MCTKHFARRRAPVGWLPRCLSAVKLACAAAVVRLLDWLLPEKPSLQDEWR